MAKVKLNPVVQQVRGRVGDLVFRRHRNQTVVGQKADLAGREATPSQAAQRERFRTAVRYGQTVLADPAKKDLYQAEAQSRKLGILALCVADFLNPPQIDQIDLSTYAGQAGQVIRVIAHDDVEVTAVSVRITDASGALVEEGQATRVGGDEWSYQATVAGPPGQVLTVTATATDRPGHSVASTATTT